MRSLPFRPQYRLRTLLAAPVMVALGFAVWSWWLAGEPRRRLERAIREETQVDETSRRVLLRMVHGNSDLGADPFPQVGVFFDTKKFFNMNSNAVFIDDSFRFFPLGLPKVVWESNLRLPDGSVRRLILFGYGRWKPDPAPTLCLLDSSYGVVAWQRVPGGVVHVVRMGSIGGDSFVEVEVERVGPCELADPLLTPVRFRVASNSLDCLWPPGASTNELNAGEPQGFENVKEWKISRGHP